MPTAAESLDVRRALEQQREELARNVAQRHYEREPEAWRGYGKEGLERCMRDARYHWMYLGEAIGASSPEVFLDYVAWLQVLFAGLGFPDHTVEDALHGMRGAIAATLSAPHAAIADEYLKSALAYAAKPLAMAGTYIQPTDGLGAIASRYLDQLLLGERRAAIQLIVGAAEDGVSVRDLYLRVFQPCQYEIGRLWQTNRISVAQEHFCTAATQLAMAQLYPYVFAAEGNGRRLLVTCVSGELHEIGARFLADLFEIEGWDTYYLGASTPTAAILRAIEDQKADVVAISATMTFHVSAVAQLIGRMRDTSAACPAIIVGGYPFNVAPDLWQRVGADGSARDAEQAIAVAGRLVGMTEA